MSHHVPCITNVLHDVASCTHRGEHLPTCPDPANCRGCEPRAARVGFVCLTCYTRIEDALAAWNDLEPALAGIDRAVTRDAVHQGKPGSRVPLAPVPLDFEAIRSYHASFTGSVERWVATAYLDTPDKYGHQQWRGSAVDAVRFARAVQQAERAHPTHEKPHDLTRTRCPECRQGTFVWHPPTFVGSPVTVECQNPQCGRSITREDSIDTIAYIEAAG